MSAITGLVDLISSFIKLITTGVSSIVAFCQYCFTAIQNLFVFIPSFLVAFIILVFTVKIVYLILGR